MKFAYADPPYPGCARAHYADDPRCMEVNQEILIGTLEAEYPDGWALSTSSSNLRTVLPMCPESVRVAAWVKPFASWKKGVVPPFAWEPVIFRTLRKRNLTGMATFGKAADWHSATPPVFLSRGGAVKGAKPLSFCLWVLDLIGFAQEDHLDDLFPGSGIMSEALSIYTRQRELWPMEMAK